jgi:hypothetical protein
MPKEHHGFSGPEVNQQAAADEADAEGNPDAAGNKDAEENKEDLGDCGNFHGQQP